MSGESGPELQGDRPLESSGNDRLGYSHFAENLADTVTSRAPTDGYTIGVYGPWGSGKSTILNFLEDELEDVNSIPAVVRFNPWWFSGRGDLVEKFLTEMGAQLESQDGFPDLRSDLANLSSALSNVPFSAITGVPAEQGFDAIHQLLQQEGESVDELKNSVHEKLEASDRQIICIIDDVDRLTPREITLMFQLIKSIADFPNVIYVLAFEQEVIVNALEKEANFRDGKRYLQKIVQLPLHIPEPKSGSLESLFLDQLPEVPGEQLVDTERWESLLRTGILPLLDTPREVIRLTNTIDVMAASVGEEVNYTDLVGLEALRVFHEEVYAEIKASPERFVGHRKPRLRRSDDPDDYNDILGDLESDRELVENILKELFPMVKDNLLNRSSGFENWDQMRVENRICHRDRISVYFRLNIPDGEISSTEMGAILSKSDDVDFLEAKIREMLDEEGVTGNSKAHTFIKRLGDRTAELQESEYQAIVSAIFATGDELINTAVLNRNKEIYQMSQLIQDILRDVDKEDRTEIISEGIHYGTSPYLASHFVNSLLRQHEEDEGDDVPAGGPLLEMEEIEALKSTVVESINEAAESGSLVDTPQLKEPLKCWRDWGDTEAPQEWVNQGLDEEFDLIEFIDMMSSTTTVNWTRPVFYVDPRWIHEWVDEDYIEKKLNDMNRSSLDEEVNMIIERYETGKQKLKDGQDPSKPGSWVGF
ncbi:hypothetical protein DJ79_08875 [Halorubrum ezzemoulense]|uniref:KAP NTPase domain-containing protein n=1 Tax=Halorubrum ezzemoulense TaxID=337243 RepID=A0A256JFM7_HALEZ|nr:P-loop NTPase fold protein [Halorubrum ezzemoulense]OYR67571.1 hypothetical protein DJ79_08875 [Halorubrum ezzemoulense]